jgi:hypothetical protein
MARDLSTPPAPRPQGALTSGMPPAPPQQMPAPSFQQTVAALRHFNAIGKQLVIALKDPDLGRTDLKSKIIDGMTTLVADRIIPPGQAVTQLATFPERPYEQRAWLLQHLQQTAVARNAVLDHHRLTNMPQPAVPPTPSADTHLDDMAGLQGHYGGGNG